MATKVQYEKYILPVGGLLLLYFGGKKILEAIGILSSDEDKAKEGTLLPGSPFSPNYWQNHPGAWLLTVGAAQAYAQVIYEAKSIFNDDEAAVYGIFQNMQTQSQVSFLAYQFQSMYGVSLAYFLQNMLSDSEFKGILDIVNSLPPYQR